MMAERGVSLAPNTILRWVEQDHRKIKSRLRTMLGFKQFENAASTIAGVELIHRIRK